MKKLPKKIATLNAEDFADLTSCCRNCLILGGLETCSCTSLDRFVKVLQIPKARILAWYKTYDKKFWKDLKKRA